MGGIYFTQEVESQHVGDVLADAVRSRARTGAGNGGSGSGRGSDRARQAAEAAISSPLLEDIKLSGAKGILVNITSGMDLTMGEFEEVGNTVKSFASDNATVVVGTVIDQNMEDQVRVTVVATGIGGDGRSEDEGISLIARPQEPEPDYKVLERPTVIRNKPEMAQAKDEKMVDPDHLDIPAFLRRQAD